jgi:bifunctional non-homologous end joining protein LigD
VTRVPDLSEYDRKRDFSKTKEPKGGKKKAAVKAPRFVVQEHHARRLHWDLRFERDGVAVSFAVPNGIPTHTTENRKAVHTEDHPLEYLEWEGEIPKGEYGGGTMRIWDRGTYEVEKWEPRKIIVALQGEMVQGRYALFPTGPEEKDWMIHRMDPPADPDWEPMPQRIVPMLAQSCPLPPDDDRYAFEIKWDGVRAIAYSEPGQIRFESRNLKDVSGGYPELRPLNRALSHHHAVLDGEIVAFDEDGKPSFHLLQSRMHVRGDATTRRLAERIPITYVIFDLLWLDGHSLMKLPYEERRERLLELGLDGPRWQTPAHRVGDGAALLAASRARGLEGIMAKRLGCPYEPGRRSGGWLKIKNLCRQEFVIGGWIPGDGRRRDRIGALAIGYFEDGELIYAGKVGTGFTEAELKRVAGILGPHEQRESPFAGTQPEKGTIFVEPCVVAEVEYLEWSDAGVLRGPSYKGLREDKDPRDVQREGARDPQAPPQEDVLADAKPLPGGARSKAVEVDVDGRTLRLTNLDKVLWPKAGFTKGQVIDYYARISPVLLPHLKDRPLTLKRYPNGVEAQHFYEKSCPKHRPDWIRTEVVSGITFCVVEDRAAMVWLGNLADLELHTPMATAVEPDRPTMVIFDLDPGPGTGLSECCALALLLRGMFGNLGLECFIKTSGSKGMQLSVPLNVPGVTEPQTKGFAKAVAETVEKAQPDRYVSRMTKALRANKVFIDWSQNDEHKTTVCVYSLRAKDRPTVSTPLTWEEVEEGVENPDALVFEAGDVLERVEEHGDLWAEVLTLQQRLPGT